MRDIVKWNYNKDKGIPSLKLAFLPIKADHIICPIKDSLSLPILTVILFYIFALLTAWSYHNEGLTLHSQGTHKKAMQNNLTQHEWGLERNHSLMHRQCKV